MQRMNVICLAPITTQELQALDRTVKQAQSAVSKSGGPSYGVPGTCGTGEDEVTSRLRSIEYPQKDYTRPQSKPAVALKIPFARADSQAAMGSIDKGLASPVAGTPWTVNNAALPAYPAQFTPQMPFVKASGAGCPGKGLVGYCAQRPCLPFLAGSHGSDGSSDASLASARYTGKPPACTTTNLGSDKALALAAGPTQEGPLALYPDYAQVDPHSKWNRIRSWAAQDSSGAAVSVDPKLVARVPHLSPPSMAAAQDDALSLGSTLMDLDAERTRVSMQAAELARAARAAADAKTVSAGIGAVSSNALKTATTPSNRPTVSQQQSVVATGAGPDTGHSVDAVLSLLSKPTGAAAVVTAVARRSFQDIDPLVCTPVMDQKAATGDLDLLPSSTGARHYEDARLKGSASGNKTKTTAADVTEVCELR